MYKIIGGDGRHYGPVSAAQVREWIAHGRANAQTLVQPENSSQWLPLAQCSDFADALVAHAVPPVITHLDNRRSKLIAGLLGILLGWLGVHRFYLGYVGLGIAQIFVTLLTLGVGWIWGLIEGILILTGSGITADAEGRPLKD